MRSLFRLSSVFVGLLYCFAIAAGPVNAQIALPPYGTIHTVVGVSTSGYSGDGGPAINAEIHSLQGLAVDANGDLYIADSQNNRIRKVTASTGVITTVAGNGAADYSGDGNVATGAALNGPSGVAVDTNGNLYIADTQNNRIRKVTVSTGVITTVAGNGTAGYSGDDTLAAGAELNGPGGVAVDASGNLYIADFQNNRIRKVTASTGVITTVAGNGTAGYSGDGEKAIDTKLNGPQNVVVDKFGNLYVADRLNNRIREVGLGGEITTVAGTGEAGYSGDNEQANTAKISGPTGLAIDASGNLLFADAGNVRIRKVVIFTGIITTVAGNGTAGFAGDDGSATSAELNKANSIATDSKGNIYIGDDWNNRVRVVGGDTAGKSAASATLGVVTPMSSSYCATIGMSVTSPFQSSGGTGTARWSYKSLAYPYCPLAAIGSDANWILFNSQTLTCPTAPDGTVTCSVNYTVGQNNNGPNRQATITANFQSPVGSLSANVFQYGPPQTLTVGVSGTGTVSSNPSGIFCPGTCSAGFSYGTTVNLTASPSASFSGWSGACSGTGACTLTMSSPASVSATFTPTFTLMVGQPSQTTPLSLGHSMTYVVSVSDFSGFVSTVALSVSGLPAGVTAQLSNPFITGAGSVTLTLTSAYRNSTFIGNSNIIVTGTSGSLSRSAGFILATQPLRYKGTCGVQ